MVSPFLYRREDKLKNKKRKLEKYGIDNDNTTKVRIKDGLTHPF